MELIFFVTSSFSRAMMKPLRGPRRVLWVVDVTTSATGTGLEYSPAAMSPDTCAMSTISSAPTASQMSRKRCQSITRE